MPDRVGSKLGRRLLALSRQGRARRTGEKRAAAISVSRLPSEALAYRDLSPFSLHFDAVELGARKAAVNVLVPSAAANAIFAGIRTALSFAGRVAVELDRPLRIVTVNRGGAPDDAAGLVRELATGLGVRRIELVRLGDGDVLRGSDDDAWIVTYWTTAHAADVARRLGRLDPSRVAYLVQDYEPGFEPWSCNHVLIRATYHAGFLLAVNSRPLARYVQRQEGVEVADDLVFAPELDFERLEEVAARRRPADRIRVFFYARPSKPRNLFPVGVAALRRAHDLLGERRRSIEVVAAGEAISHLNVGRGRQASVLGRISWDRYYEVLAATDVGLSLMESPHPSHPPLELAVSGAVAVTNAFGDARHGLHPRLLAVPADPDELALALIEAVTQARREPAPPYAPIGSGLLGHPMEEVAVRSAVALVR